MYVARQSGKADEPEKEKDKEEEMDGNAILFMLQSVPENVLNWAEFAEWFTGNCATVISVDEGVGLTSALVPQIDIDEVDEMIGNYLVNFTWPSLMKGTGSR